MYLPMMQDLCVNTTITSVVNASGGARPYMQTINLMLA